MGRRRQQACVAVSRWGDPVCSGGEARWRVAAWVRRSDTLGLSHGWGQWPVGGSRSYGRAKGCLGVNHRGRQRGGPRTGPRSTNI